jgi:hypothetical protein
MNRIRSERFARRTHGRRSASAKHRAGTAGFALARGGFGLALIVAPERIGRPWLGAATGEPPMQVAIRCLGARDLVLSGGALVTVCRRADTRPWLVAAVAADCADIASTFAGRDVLPRRSPAGTALLAGVSAVVGGALVASAGKTVP